MTPLPRQTPLSLEHVTIDDAFWAPRLRTNRTATLPTIYQHLKETGRLDVWRLGESVTALDPHPFWDSDVAKWIEATAYRLTTHPDPALEDRVDTVIRRIADAQHPDGYVNTYFTAVEPDQRWTNLRSNHELYCAGHLIEAAVAYVQATGKRNLLNVACRFADYIDAVFGGNAGQIRGYPGHPEIELALVKLYRVTDDERYLNLARFFIDERGRSPHYFDEEAKQHGVPLPDHYIPGHGYNQSHKPVREQHEVVGHAVRAMYLYCGMADVAAETGDSELIAACRRLWRHATSTRMYVTGGLGSSPQNEGFTTDYDLPNQSAYAETCAAVGFVFWNHRMLQLTGDRRYADAMERALYNGMLSGIGLDGRRFFYVNPLQSTGDHHRQDWFGCACCPPNVARLLASLGRYAYAQTSDTACVHLYLQSEARFTMDGQPFTLVQTTDYPWKGLVRLRIEADGPVSCTLALRIPSWCATPSLQIKGRYEPLAPLLDRGYAHITRTWHPGDFVTLTLPMPIERIQAHPHVRNAAGRIALQRGPLVYCLEEADNNAPLDALQIPRSAPLNSQFETDLLDGLVSITGPAQHLNDADWNDETLYRPAADQVPATDFKAIPYCAWDNRAPGEMLVWISDGGS